MQLLVTPGRGCLKMVFVLTVQIIQEDNLTEDRVARTYAMIDKSY